MVNKLVDMLRQSHGYLIDCESDDASILIGNLGEFLALWDGDEGAFSCDDDKTPALVELVRQLREAA
jgi:hypothetical protein